MMRYHSDVTRSIERDPGLRLIALSLACGLLLNLLPYPDAWFEYKPDFVALLLAYWALRMRRSFPFAVAFAAGILMDVAYTAALGQHAFAYAALLLVAHFLKRPYVIANRAQQAVFAGLALAAAIAASLLVSRAYESIAVAPADFKPALVGMLLWLLLPLLLAPRPPAGG